MLALFEKTTQSIDFYFTLLTLFQLSKLENIPRGGHQTQINFARNGYPENLFDSIVKRLYKHYRPKVTLQTFPKEMFEKLFFYLLSPRIHFQITRQDVILWSYFNQLFNLLIHSSLRTKSMTNLSVVDVTLLIYDKATRHGQH